MPLEILYAIGALALLAILIWAVAVPQLKSPKARALREEATREEFKDPERYAQKDQDKLAAEAKQAEESTRTLQS
ncbi:hypothetical protein [Henriciella aquimarina]|uniref:hypothetical protein n=1 Tax=Henriciella aquimarina TaxID=545261 RepID=UPI000A02CD42|nr:hypothetical protein [Henriciella aquimarina]